MAEKRYFSNLQELRGLAATLIVLSHIPFFENLIGTSWGGYGVTVFFLLSGFLLMFSTEKNTDRFLIKRIARIIPLFWTVTIFTFVIARLKPDWFNTTVATVPNLIKSLLFIPYVNPNGNVRPILDVSWALFPEVWLYVVFFIAMKVSHRYRGLLSGVVFFCLFIISIGPGSDSPIFAQYKLSFLTLPLGMLVYYFWSTGKLNQIREWVNRLEKWILIVIFWLVGLAYNYLTIAGWNYFGVVLTVIVFIVFLITEGLMKKNKLLGTLGQISYSMYLIHEFIVKGFSRLIYPLDGITFISFVLSIACLGATITLAYFVNKYYERPMSEFVLQSLKKNGR